MWTSTIKFCDLNNHRKHFGTTYISEKLGQAELGMNVNLGSPMLFRLLNEPSLYKQAKLFINELNYN